MLVIKKILNDFERKLKNFRKFSDFFPHFSFRVLGRPTYSQYIHQENTVIFRTKIKFQYNMFISADIKLSYSQH